jgi:hypothetical protein
MKDIAFPALKKWQLAIEQPMGLCVGMFCYDRGKLKTNSIETWLATQGTE